MSPSIPLILFSENGSGDSSVDASGDALGTTASGAALAVEGGGGNNKSIEIEALQQQVADLLVIKEEHIQLKREFEQFKIQVEKWQTKHKKLVTDLMEEVDEEKKIRLATEVEMRRIKKMVQP